MTRRTVNYDELTCDNCGTQVNIEMGNLQFSRGLLNGWVQLEHVIANSVVNAKNTHHFCKLACLNEWINSIERVHK